MKILHLEDSPTDAFIIQRALRRYGIDADVNHTVTAEQFRDAVAAGDFDVVLLDSGVPGIDGREAMKYVRQRFPDVPLIFCSGTAREQDVLENVRAGGANDFVLKDQLWQLVLALRRVAAGAPAASHAAPTHAAAAHAAQTAATVTSGNLVSPLPQTPTSALERLLRVVQDLSLVRSMEQIQEIVRHAARELTGCDGATFVLRDGEQCYYADEDAISPLWKGQRFPLSACISGWAMLNGRAAVIEDIYADARIPHDAYRPTFVKSLAMVPIRAGAPLGAIGNYWAQRHAPTEHEVALLQSLASTTAVAIENVQLLSGLEQRVQQRTRELESANRQLEAFSSAVSHDLRAPLRAFGYSLDLLEEEQGAALPASARTRMAEARGQVGAMGRLIDDLLRLSSVARADLQVQPLDLSALVREICERDMALLPPERRAQLTLQIEPGVTMMADPALIRAALDNLVSNAIKYSGRVAQPRIEFGRQQTADGTVAYFVRDNGAGFDMRHAARLFSPFQRLHAASEFPGTGVGLATVQRIVEKHGGRIWAESTPGKGATFFFTLAC